jgi:hypothetical protein
MESERDSSRYKGGREKADELSVKTLCSACFSMNHSVIAIGHVTWGMIMQQARCCAALMIHYVKHLNKEKVSLFLLQNNPIGKGKKAKLSLYLTK